MIRTLLATTALTTMLVGAAFAQDAAAPAPGGSALLTEGYNVVDTDGLASKLIGFPVYSSAQNDAEQLGEINDIVIAQDGQVAAVIIGVGGFLGVGEKNVSASYGDLQWVTAEDNTERLVLETTREALNAAPAVEMLDDEPMETAVTTDQPADAMDVEPADAMDTAASDQPVDAMDDDPALETGAIGNQPADTMDRATQPMDRFDPANLTEFDESTLTAEELIGTNVYGPENEHIGAIGDLVLGQDEGTIDAIIVDFGGFLGIGVKEVAVGYDDLTFYIDDVGNRSLLIDVTREQMEQAVAFNRDTYNAERDTQRMSVSSL